jgi:hypothetical protein
LSSLLCCELSFVNTTEIERAEKTLMEGINYEFLCHHANTTLQKITKDLTNEWNCRSRRSDDDESLLCLERSLASFVDAFGYLDVDQMMTHFSELEQRVLMYTDATFLFDPFTLGLAIAAVDLSSYDDENCLGELMQEYLLVNFPLKSEDELIQMYREVNEVLDMLLSSQVKETYPVWHSNSDFGKGESLVASLVKAERLRISRNIQVASPREMHHAHKRKVSTMDIKDFHARHEEDFDARYSKLAKITP